MRSRLRFSRRKAHARTVVVVGVAPRLQVVVPEVAGSSSADDHGPSETIRARLAAFPGAFHSSKQRRSEGPGAPMLGVAPIPRMSAPAASASASLAPIWADGSRVELRGPDRWQRILRPVDDADIHDSIEQLVAEEHELWDRQAAGAATEADRQRLQEVKVALDRCWDLLRQRRALEEFGLDPGAAHVRSSDTVEGYEQ